MQNKFIGENDVNATNNQIDQGNLGGAVKLTF
jgi:hypothetical protein